MILAIHRVVVIGGYIILAFLLTLLTTIPCQKQLKKMLFRIVFLFVCFLFYLCKWFMLGTVVIMH